MDKRISLVYEDKCYQVLIGEAVVFHSEDMEKAYEHFKKEIRNNGAGKVDDWEQKLEEVKRFAVEGLAINEAYKNISLGQIKYFYQSDQVFFAHDGKMTPLFGGFSFLLRILRLIDKGYLDEGDKLVALCYKAASKAASYMLTDDRLTISSAAFTYGKVSYTFEKKKMDMGTAHKEIDFDGFAEYVMHQLL